MSQKEETSNEYSFEKKKRLAAKISDMRSVQDKPVLRKIKDIIFDENPGISAKKSSYGYLMYFQNYTPETYKKIERYLERVESEKVSRAARAITETSEHMIFSSEDPNSDYSNTRTRLRYSNKERRLIKRQHYEDIINEPLSTNDRESSSSSKTDDVEQSPEITVKRPVKTNANAGTKPTTKITQSKTTPTIVSKTSAKTVTNNKTTTVEPTKAGAVTAKSTLKKNIDKRTQSTIFTKISK
jgi:hypothetical protein